MDIKYEYTTEEERQAIVDANPDKYFYLEGIAQGNKYLMCRVKTMNDLTVEQLQDNQLTIMEALADLYTTLMP